MHTIIEIPLLLLTQFLLHISTSTSTSIFAIPYSFCPIKISCSSKFFTPVFLRSSSKWLDVASKTPGHIRFFSFLFWNCIISLSPGFLKRLFLQSKERRNTGVINSPVHANWMGQNTEEQLLTQIRNLLTLEYFGFAQYRPGKAYAHH